MDEKELAELNTARQAQWFESVVSFGSRHLLRDLLHIVAGYSFTPEKLRFEWKKARGYDEDDCELICFYEGFVLHVGVDNPLGWDWTVSSVSKDWGQSEDFHTRLNGRNSFPSPRTWREACSFAEMVADYRLLLCDLYPSGTDTDSVFSCLTQRRKRNRKRNRPIIREIMPNFPLEAPSEDEGE